MEEYDSFLYACCPVCSKPIGKSKRCDGMELSCPKCGSKLQLIVGKDVAITIKLVQVVPPKQGKPNTSVAP